MKLFMVNTGFYYSFPFYSQHDNFTWINDIEGQPVQRPVASDVMQFRSMHTHAT